jgi:hypothetical protein
MSSRGPSCLPVVLVTLLIAAGFMGCGSSGSETSAPLSKSAYIKQGNQICKKRGEEKDQAVKTGLADIPPSEFPEPSPAVMEKLSESALPYFQRAVTELAALPPPAKDRATVERFVEDLEAASARTQAHPLLLVHGDPFSEAAKGARNYGLVDCIL